MRPRRHRLAVLALATSVGLVGVACGGGGGDDEQVAPSTTTAGTTTSEATTSSAPTTVADTTTTTLPPPTYPLTGMPVTDPALAARPALAVKIDNHPQQSRPQSGIDKADLVVEETVDGGLSRFVAIFQSQDADPVGPIRSARTSDPYILANVGEKVLLAWSGGNQGVRNDIHSKDFLLDLGAESHAPLYFRDRAVHKGVDSEHTLYSKTPDLYAFAADPGNDRVGTTPHLPFTFRPAGAPLNATAEPTGGVHVVFSAVNADFTWNATTSSWDRVQNGTPHVSQQGGQVSPANVVVLFVPYGRSAADPRTPEARPIGDGTAWVFTQGKLIQGTWARKGLGDPYTLTDGAGQPIGLTPGQTWVELPQGDGNAQLLAPPAP